MANLAPIVLFACNRPQHTLNTLESLRQNELASLSDLTIVCDGARPDAELSELENIRLVRKIAKSENWCHKTTVLENDTNEKLPNLLPRILREFFEHHDRIIVLEDDLYLSRGFLKYMNEALELYKDDEKVMHISGYIYPVDAPLEETSFLILSSNWGWGTWKRAWKKFIPDPAELLSRFQDPAEISRLNVEHTHDYYSLLKRCVESSWKSWDIRWYASVVLNHGLCLHPRISLVRNTGNDASGVNCGEDDTFQYQETSDYIAVKRIPLEESERSRNAVRKFYRRSGGTDMRSRMKTTARTLVPPVVTALLTSNKSEKSETRKSIRSFLKLFVPPVLRKWKPAQLKAEINDVPSSESYWSGHKDLLEYWGQGNAWNEIESFLYEKSGKVLDIACGTGPVIKLLEKYPALDVYGVDNNEFLILQAQEKDIPANKLFVRDATDLGIFQDREFSFTYSIGLIYYFDEPTLDKFIAENARITQIKSYHFILCNKGLKDEEWIFTWQKYRNNAASWWKKKFERVYSRVTIINSSWHDTDYNRSKGIWLICEK